MNRCRLESIQLFGEKSSIPWIHHCPTCDRFGHARYSSAIKLAPTFYHLKMHECLSHRRKRGHKKNISKLSQQPPTYRKSHHQKPNTAPTVIGPYHEKHKQSTVYKTFTKLPSSPTAISLASSTSNLKQQKDILSKHNTLSSMTISFKSPSHFHHQIIDEQFQYMKLNPSLRS